MFIARWWRIVVTVFFAATPVSPIFAQGWQGNAPDIAWTSPNATSIKNVSEVSGLAQSEDIYHLNYDCQPRMYRMSYGLLDSSMQAGCFVTTAFGSMDITNGAVEGFGTDGALQLKPPLAKEVIVPLPKEATVAAMYPSPILGAYMHLYSFSAPKLQYDWTGTKYLQLPPQPSQVVSDSFGNPILMNTQSIAFSTSGSWMVVESPWHSFLRINTATLDVLPFAEPLTGTPYDTATHDSQVAISDDGRYVAIQIDHFDNFKVYDLKTCTGTVTADLKPLNCQSHNYSSYVSSQVPGWRLTRHLRFVNDGLLSFRATGDDGDKEYVLAPNDSITNLTEYLALGDSYTSGEGAFNYIEGTDTANNMCHLSSNSYPFLLTRDVFNDGHSVACSGAIINDITDGSDGYTGQTINKVPLKDRINNDNDFVANTSGLFTPGYLPQDYFVQQYQPRVLTVSVGGDDIGFGDIIASCVSPIKQPWPPEVNPNTCYGTYEERMALMNNINNTYSKWVGLYQQLQKVAPSTRIYAIGYPHIAKVGGDCGLNVHLNASEVEFSEELIDYLNSVIQQAATDAGVTYIDISHALDGHRLCEASGSGIAMNGLTAGTDKFHVLGKESYHPNALGQELIEQAILHGTHNFTDAPTAPSDKTTLTTPAVPVNSPLLNEPKSGQPVYAWLPDDSISDSLLVKGTTASITVSGEQNSLAPNSSFTITLRQDNTFIGNISSDNNGNLTGTMTIPANASTGEQVLDVIGQNETGQLVDVSKTVYIAASGADYDGDSVPNEQDSCPSTPNISIDADHDGIDDACDSFIDLTVVSNSGGQQSSLGTSSDSSMDSSSLPSTVTTNASGKVLTVQDSQNITANITTLTGTSQAPYTNPATAAVLGASTDSSVGGQPLSSIAAQEAGAENNKPTTKWEPWIIGSGIVLTLISLLAKLFGVAGRK